MSMCFTIDKSYLIFLLVVSGFVWQSCDKKPETPDNPEPPEIEKGLPQFYITGNRTDKTTNHQSGIVLAGGGSDNDNAMKWMMQRAAGGDVVVLRASGADGYNGYLFSQLATTLNSVTSIVIDTRDKAQKDSVYRTIRRAEALFIAGGNQLDYVDNWKGTKVAEAIDYLIQSKKVVVGGTSAGMAVLGQICYSAGGGGQGNLTSETALSNPAGNDITLVKDFIKIPLLESIVTDSHFSERNRMGRLVCFMARAATDWNVAMKGVACDENTAICIDEMGAAKVFGSGKAFFLKQSGEKPETLEKNAPLTWNRNEKALFCEEIQGSNSPEVRFNIKSWLPTVPINGYYLYVINGELKKSK